MSRDISPEDLVKKIYIDLMKQGWTLNDIDEMDIHYYFELLDYNEEPQTKRGFIDQVL